MNVEKYISIEKQLRRDGRVQWSSPKELDALVRIYAGELTREQKYKLENKQSI